jgi:simple sugar transport system permease protein
MDFTMIAELAAATIRISTPLLFAALGGLLSEKAGTFAVGIEGMMLAGAFTGAISAFVFGNVALGFVLAGVGGATTGSLLAFATARCRADQMVTGLAVNVLVLGLSSFLLRGLFGGRAPVVRLTPLGTWPLPWLSEIPIVGPVLFRQSAIVYLAFLLVVPVTLFLTKTRAGLILRAVGENPEATFAAGYDPIRIRMIAIVAGGALAGLGGAVLALQEVGSFTDGMTNGRGFIALAAIMVGRWTPVGAIAGCLIFGFVSALELRAQSWGLPVSSYVMQMMPYCLALALLAGVSRSARLPAAIGVPFIRH